MDVEIKELSEEEAKALREKHKLNATHWHRVFSVQRKGSERILFFHAYNCLGEMAERLRKDLAEQEGL